MGVMESLRQWPAGRKLVHGIAWTGLEVVLAVLLILGLLPAVARAAG